VHFLILLLFSLNTSATSKDCLVWFDDWKLSRDDKNCEIKCLTAPKNLPGAFCDCKELCKKSTNDLFAPYVFYPGLSLIERELIVSDPKSSLKVYINKKLAEKIADKYFSNGGHNDESDALRHFVWAGLLTFDLGKEKAQLYLDAHEQISYQPISEKEMDIHNNTEGIEAALILIKENKANIENLTSKGLSKLKDKSLIVNKPTNKIPKEYKK